MPELFTIGYEKAGQPALVERLVRAGVRTLIDVRELPLSRRAGFSKGPLSAALRQAGIEYLHLKALGTPKEGRLAGRAGNQPLFWSIVDQALARPEAQYELGVAAATALNQGPACLLCLEDDPHICHRSRVAADMAAGWGFDVHHLSVDAAF
ncbi:DUF488 domain-containing protein [Nitrospirillum sp. BR 11163]|uniref:DUF488 domain-containing protein n=1 Tax=Nitrospirillum sp. BR 11163 TaxID=3104323 RepID=UPI002AFF2090|nr:DUF488 domain-containing protein [Nitrospirillum sp. BR 11163]MEA1675422.1 DUF488 domain-containing protein [Nitrospirillum sp. BR 11163]